MEDDGPQHHWTNLENGVIEKKKKRKKKKGQVIVKKAPETSKSGTCPLPNTKISHM
jgi:hypothetical protein